MRYIAQSTEPMDDPRFAALGIPAGSGGAVRVTRLALLRCSAKLIDGDLVSAAFGGFFGEFDDRAAYASFFDLAVAHERVRPEAPWVLIIHPHISGNRAWAGLQSFLRRLRGEFGSEHFKTAREAALGH